MSYIITTIENLDEIPQEDVKTRSWKQHTPVIQARNKKKIVVASQKLRPDLDGNYVIGSEFLKFKLIGRFVRKQVVANKLLGIWLLLYIYKKGTRIRYA